MSSSFLRFDITEDDTGLLQNKQLDQVIALVPFILFFFIGVVAVMTKGDFSGYKSTVESTFAFCVYVFFTFGWVFQIRKKDFLIQFLKKDQAEGIAKKSFCQQLLLYDLTNPFNFFAKQILVELGQNNSCTQAYIAYMNAMKEAINDLESVDLGKAESLRRVLMNTSGYKQAMIFADRCQAKTGGHLRAVV
jgi:hypothetical protein